MAKYFQITIPDGASNVRLDSQGRAAVQYTVRNVSAAPIDGRAALVSVPGTAPGNDPVQKKWVSIDPPPERHFDKDKEEVFKVTIAVPTKSAQPGEYTFRLNVASVAVPDVGDQGPPVKFTVAQLQKSSSKMGLWIALAAVVVLAVGGLAAWLLLKPKGIAMPDHSGPTRTDPDACKDPSFVWRNARDGDHVCVTAATRDQAADDNRQAASRLATATYGPDTCAQGFVWRDAFANDHVCVPPATRAQAADDNNQAAARRTPGPFGPDTCIQGYVWREASPTDHVCVPPATRTQAADDNRQAASRLATATYGPDTCAQGFVWRDAFANDHVCVPVATRTQAAQDNAAAASRKASSQ